MKKLVQEVKSYSEFDVLDPTHLRNYLSENLVMNYNNIEID